MLFFHTFSGKACAFSPVPTFASTLSVCLSMLPVCDSMFLPAELALGIKNAAWFRDDPSARVGKAGGRDLLQPGVPASSPSLPPHRIFPFRN